MIRKILVIISTFVLILYLSFYGDIFDFNFNQNQISSIKFIFKSYLIVSSVCFITGELTKNYSQIDKVWSLVPIFVVWYFTLSSNFNHRMILMSVLVTIWGLRLTYNFSRRGGYSIYFWKGEEDYRWKEVRKSISLFRSNLNWSLFNLLFICFYQMGLIFLFSLPILAAWQGSENAINYIDYIISFLMLLFIITETIADQQQYSFQSEKYRIHFNGPQSYEVKQGDIEKYKDLKDT